MKNYKTYSMACLYATNMLIKFSDELEELPEHKKDGFYKEQIEEVNDVLNLQREIYLGEGDAKKAHVVLLAQGIVINHLEERTAHKVLIVVPSHDGDTWEFESTLVEEVPA